MPDKRKVVGSNPIMSKVKLLFMLIKKYYKKFLKIDRKINKYIEKKERKNAHYLFNILVYFCGSYLIIVFVLKLMGWIS